MFRIYANFLKEHASEQENSVQSYIINHQKIWLKKASQRHSTWIYLPLQWFSKLLGLSMLAPVPNHGGEEAIACEISRIKTLKKLDIHVPDILAHQNNAFILKDASPNGEPVTQLEHALSIQETSEQRLTLFSKAIKALENIHQKNNYLSEAFARNILVGTDQKFSFIDFETDPGQYLSLKDCHTRDWLCFIFSTTHRFEEHELNQASKLLVNTLKSSPDVFNDICRVGRKITWLLKLKPEKLGNDGKRLTKCISILQMLNNQRELNYVS